MSATIDEMMAYALAITEHVEEIVTEIEFIRNLTEADIDNAKGSIGQDVIQQLAGAIADVCDTGMGQVTALRQTASELQHAIQNAGG